MRERAARWCMMRWSGSGTRWGRRALRQMTTEERDGVLEWCIDEALKRTEESVRQRGSRPTLQVQREQAAQAAELRGWSWR